MMTRSSMRLARSGDPKMIFRAKAVEARDLWDISKSNMALNQQSVINKNLPETIATHIATSTARVPDSIPNATFKGGFYPHTYTTLNYEEQAEPDTQRIVQNLSPLEFASLGRMDHAVPPKLNDALKLRRPDTFSENLDAVVTGRRKWKTSDAIRRKGKVKFQPYTRTSTNLPMYKMATSGASGNRQLLQGRPSIGDEIANLGRQLGNNQNAANQALEAVRGDIAQQGVEARADAIRRNLGANINYDAEIKNIDDELEDMRPISGDFDDDEARREYKALQSVRISLARDRALQRKRALAALAAAGGGGGGGAGGGGPAVAAPAPP